MYSCKADDSIYMKEILDLVDTYIKKKHSEKKWVAGKDWVQYAGPYFSSSEYILAIKSLLGGWLVLGKDALLFESRFAKLFDKKLGVLTNSGSSANLLMMLAMTSSRYYNFPRGTKVITPIAGFPTTVNPIFQCGFTPIFVDIELDTLNIDLNQLELTCKQHSDAKIITFAHCLGNPPDMRRLMQIVKDYNLILLEDCCDALGSTYDGKPLGSFGDMASCSFYPAHHITMGEGGIVTMNSIEFNRIVKSFRDWGRDCYCEGKQNLLENGKCGCRFSNWIPSLSDKTFDHKYVYTEIGYNLKPIELQAAMGLAQLEKLDEVKRIRKENYKRLYGIFSKYEEFFHLHNATPNSDPSWFAFPITLKSKSLISRSEFCTYLEKNKIQTRPYFAGNLMLQPAYDLLGEGIDYKNNFPIASKVTVDTFFLGTSPVITGEQLDYIEQIVDKFFSEL